MEKVRQLIAPFRAHILRTAKAYVSALVGTLVAWLLSNGVEIPSDVQEAVTVVLVFGVTWFFTWLIPNKA